MLYQFSYLRCFFFVLLYAKYPMHNGSFHVVELSVELQLEAEVAKSKDKLVLRERGSTHHKKPWNMSTTIVKHKERCLKSRMCCHIDALRCSMIPICLTWNRGRPRWERLVCLVLFPHCPSAKSRQCLLAAHRNPGCSSAW